MSRSAAISGADRLARMASYARAAADDGDEQAADILASLEQVLAAGGSLDEALGLRAQPGQPRWSTVAAREKRDSALRELAERHFGELEIGERIRAVGDAVSRYDRREWQIDRRLPSLPPRFVGTPRDLLHAAFIATEGKVPTSPKHLRRILA
jgi:hypothetical protein